ncbi:MAG: hypothetical protein ACREFD_11750 [Stellaceae bacterium]
MPTFITPRRDAERHSAVRITVTRDQFGRDRQYDDMRRWLDATIEPGRYWFAGERMPPLPDTLLFDFIAVADAQAFVDHVGRWRMAAPSPRAAGQRA